MTQDLYTVISKLPSTAVTLPTESSVDLAFVAIP